MSELLAALPGHAFAAALLFARIGTALMLMPGVGEAEVPVPVRLAFAVVLTALLFPPLAPALPAAPGDVGRMLALVACETTVGLWLGFLARLALFALVMAGQLTSLLLGFASVLTADAVLGPHGTALSRLFMLAGVALVLSAGLHALPLAALKASYALIPPGEGFAMADAAEMLHRAVAGSIGLALQLAAPFLLAAVLAQAALGLLSRLVPQVQVYFLALPAQLLAGIGLLAALIVLVLATWREHAAALIAVFPGGA